jgi:hypothetical protein
MQWFVQTLRDYPEIASFLTPVLGFWFGESQLPVHRLGEKVTVNRRFIFADSNH